MYDGNLPVACVGWLCYNGGKMVVTRLSNAIRRGALAARLLGASLAALTMLPLLTYPVASVLSLP
jgi:hypothetical protein